MSSRPIFPRRLYSLLLHLFPAQFRQEFGEEMESVFEEAAHQAKALGTSPFLIFCLRELLCLPPAALHEHMREWINMKNRRFLGWTLTRVPRRELLAALLLYLLMTLAFFFSSILQGNALLTGIQSTLALGILGVMVIVSLIGLYKRFPDWSLPAFGLLCTFALFVVSTTRPFSSWVDWWMQQIALNTPLVLRDLVSQGRIWLMLLVTPILIVVLSLPRTPARRFLAQFKSDWTRFAFLLYGAMPWVLVLAFDEYTHDEGYQALAAGALMLGAWGYLTSAAKWQRLLVLLVSLSAVMLVITVGKWLILPLQTWPLLDHYSVSRVRENETMSSIIIWIWMLFLIVVSAALGFLFRSRESPRLQRPAES